MMGFAYDSGSYVPALLRVWYLFAERQTRWSSVYCPHDDRTGSCDDFSSASWPDVCSSGEKEGQTEDRVCRCLSPGPGEPGPSGARSPAALDPSLPGAPSPVLGPGVHGFPHGALLEDSVPAAVPAGRPATPRSQLREPWACRTCCSLEGRPWPTQRHPRPREQTAAAGARRGPLQTPRPCLCVTLPSQHYAPHALWASPPLTRSFPCWRWGQRSCPQVTVLTA